MNEKEITINNRESSPIKGILSKNTTIGNKLKVDLINIREEYKS